jgi:hypothetical protein
VAALGADGADIPRILWSSYPSVPVDHWEGEMNYKTNAYYHPEALGLEIIAEIDYSDGSYQFDQRIVWRHKETGKLYTARDSGCSCPTPFENYDTIESLADYSYDFVHSEALEEGRSQYYSGDSVPEFVEKLPR